jgi:hypothetical protein
LFALEGSTERAALALGARWSLRAPSLSRRGPLSSRRGPLSSRHEASSSAAESIEIGEAAAQPSG